MTNKQKWRLRDIPVVFVVCAIAVFIYLKVQLEECPLLPW